MNRREFSAGAAGVLATAALGLPGMAWAQAKKPEDGVEYLTLGKPVNTDAPPGKIEVIEFFWYSCPHCNAFEPRLVQWTKQVPPDVFVRRPELRRHLPRTISLFSPTEAAEVVASSSS